MTDFVFSNVELVHLGFEIWSGERKLEREDFDAAVVPDLPDEKVASLGRKKLIDTNKHLKPMMSLRNQATQLLDKEGIRFMGGFAIPEDSISRVSLQLRSLCDEFKTELNKFIDNYDNAVDEWIAENPDFGEAIRASKLPSGIVKSRCKADFAIYRVSSSKSDDSGSLERQGSGMWDSRRVFVNRRWLSMSLPCSFGPINVGVCVEDHPALPQ